MTTIADGKVVFFHYTLTDDDGQQIDTSRGSEPMPYLHGSESIVPGLERQLTGKSVGDRLNAVVPPEEGYGPPSGRPPQPVPRSAFEGVEPQAGMPLVVEDDDGRQMQLWITDVSEDAVMLSSDHPLAGVTLHFDVEIMEVRDATEAELAQSQAGPDDGDHH